MLPTTKIVVCDRNATDVLQTPPPAAPQHQQQLLSVCGFWLARESLEAGFEKVGCCHAPNSTFVIVSCNINQGRRVTSVLCPCCAVRPQPYQLGEHIFPKCNANRVRTSSQRDGLLTHTRSNPKRESFLPTIEFPAFSSS